MPDNTVGLSKDPKYKNTVAKTIALLKEIHGHVENKEYDDALGKLDFAIEAFEGKEQI